MDSFVIQGGKRLSGRVRVNGSKNAALPMLAVALLTDEPVTLRDVPNLADIRNMLRLLRELGIDRLDTPSAGDGDDGEIEGGSGDGVAGGSHEGVRGDEPWTDGTITLQSADNSKTHARYDIVKTMRASICTLGPMLAKRGVATISMPGGCAIGDRPVDLHLRGLKALGAEITLDSGNIIARKPKAGLVGTTVFLGGPFGSTVLGTANVLCAATLAKGTTIIECAACEPEIVDLCNLLAKMGAKIRGAGGPRLIIEGVEQLGGADHAVIPDRIEAGTLMMAGAMTNGDIVLDNCPVDALLASIYTLQSVGVHVQPIGAPMHATGKNAVVAGDDARKNPSKDPHLAQVSLAKNQLLTLITGSSDPRRHDDPSDPMRRTVRITTDRELRPVDVTTQPHPGYPTDLQAQLVALLSIADGNSVVTERIFPDRFLHVAELLRMGAKIARTGPTVVITGVKKLHAAPVMASDLRASASLVIAGLAARGTTIVNRVYHLDRGYESLEDRLRGLGAIVQRVDEKELSPSDTAAFAGG